MRRLQHIPASLVMMASVVAPAHAEMQRLNDSDLSGVSGQSGITMEVDLKASADRLSYFDDGAGIHVEGLRIGSATDPNGTARHVIKTDILQDASVNLDYLVEDRRIEFSDVTVGGASGGGIGGVFLDQSMEGSLTLSPGGATADGYTFDVNYEMTEGRLGYRTNGYEVFLDGVSMTMNAPGITLDEVGGALEIASPSVTGSYTVDAIRYSNNPQNHGNSSDVLTGEVLPSYGSLSGDFDYSSETTITAGGRFGSEGIRLDGETVINSANFIYRDDGNPIALRNISGNSQYSDLRVDVAPDWNGRNGLALTLGELTGEFQIGSVELGGNGGSIGQLAFNYRFADRAFHGQDYTNAVYVMGGGHPDAGPQGLRLATQWSLANADFAWTEDGNTVIFSGLQSWGRVTSPLMSPEIRPSMARVFTTVSGWALTVSMGAIA